MDDYRNGYRIIMTEGGTVLSPKGQERPAHRYTGNDGSVRVFWKYRKNATEIGASDAIAATFKRYDEQR
jgi:hypothetical protein